MNTKREHIGKHFAATDQEAAEIKAAVRPNAKTAAKPGVTVPAEPATTAATDPTATPDATPATEPAATSAVNPTAKQQDKGRSRKARSKKRRGKDILAAILAVIGIALLVAGGWLWWDAQSQYNFQAETNEKLAAYAKVSDDGSTPPQVDWASLKAVNADVCAWIQVPGTPVNFPVYKGATNDTYLRTNAFGSYSIGGQVFLDSSNTSADLTQEQTIAYGHHLNDGSMFAALAKMDEQSYFDSIKRVWWVVPIAHEDGTYGQENFLCEPLFCYKVGADDKTVRTFQWSSPAEFHSYLTNKLSSAEAKAADADTTIPSIEHVLTLVTCNYTEGEGRTIIVCNPTQQTTQATVQYQ